MLEEQRQTFTCNECGHTREVIGVVYTGCFFPYNEDDIFCPRCEEQEDEQ